jgi:hypothetical protein
MFILGLVIFASVFVLAGVNHIKGHTAMAGFTTSKMGECPLAAQIGYIGGWPTGVFLILFGLGAVVMQDSFYFFGLAGFLAVATAIFHRDFLTDPGGFKGLSLGGAALAIGMLLR